MTLRSRIQFAATAIRLTGGAAVLFIAHEGSEITFGFVATLLWLFVSGPLLRQLILPTLFPDTVCAGCLRRVPLIARWKCGDHYTDHTDRHILAFHCNQGHILEGFDCPRCKSTILIQRGDRKLLRIGVAVRLQTFPLLPVKGLLIGHDNRGAEVRLPAERLAWHVALTGGTGRGKSTLLANLILQLIEQDAGCTLLDPGGDLAQLVRSTIPHRREDDVLYLNVADTANPFPLNILSAPTAMEQAMLAEELIEVFRQMHGSSWGPVLEHQLRMGLRAAMSAGGSLKDVYSLFTSDAERMRIIRQVTDRASKSFWVNEFAHIPEIRKSAVLNKLAPIVFHPVLGPIIGGRDCIVNADEIIANRRIVIVSLWTGSPADDVTGLLGTFLVQKIIAAAFRQGRLPEAARVPHFLFVDEFQRFLHRASSFNQIITEARKYRLSLLIANQYAEQLNTDTRAAIFGNIGALLAFRVGHRDARLLTDEFTGSTIEDLMELNIGQCLARIGNDWSLVRTLPPPRMGSTRRLVPAVNYQPEVINPDQSQPKEVLDDDDRATPEDDDYVR